MGKDEKNRCWVGFDFGGTKMMAVVFDHRFRKLHAIRKKTKGGDGMAAGLERMVGMIEDALDAAGMEKEQVGAIGMGCPGPLDLEKGIILETPNIGWHDVPVKSTLEDVFKRPVTIANDVDAGTYGEYAFGVARKARCVVGVFPGTGIGGACVYEGRLLRGRNRSCMEIGHFPVDPLGSVVALGRHGTLEAVASRLAISAQAASAVYRGQAPALRELAGTDLAKIKSGNLAQAIREGDAIIEEIVRLAARRLGTVVGGVVNLLAPDVLVLGGGLVEAMPDLYIEEVQIAVRETVVEAFAAALQVKIAELGDDAVAMGAAALAAEAVVNGK